MRPGRDRVPCTQRSCFMCCMSNALAIPCHQRRWWQIYTHFDKTRSSKIYELSSCQFPVAPPWATQPFHQPCPPPPHLRCHVCVRTTNRHVFLPHGLHGDRSGVESDLRRERGGHSVRPSARGSRRRPNPDRRQQVRPHSRCHAMYRAELGLRWLKRGLEGAG